MRTRYEQRGFLFLLTLFTLTGMLTLSVVGLGRSMTETSAATRYVAITQAFHLAEAGVDRALTDPGVYGVDKPRFDGTVKFTTTDINKLLQGPNGRCDPNDPDSDDGELTLAGSPGYTLRLLDNADDAPNPPAPCTDTDQMVILVATGRSAGMPQTVRVTLELPVASSPGPFDYTILADRINLDGNSIIGDAANRAKIYVQGWAYMGAAGGDPWIVTSGANRVLASDVQFFIRPAEVSGQNAYDGKALGTSALSWRCPNCVNADGSYNTTVYPPPVTFTWNLQDLNTSTTFALQPYYDEALRQEGIDGVSYHHVIGTEVISGGTNATPRVIEGVIYVECGADLRLKGNIELHGIIMHEGCGGEVSLTSDSGGVKGKLTIKSDQPTSFGGPFAKGLAIIGAPSLNFNNGTAIDIRGFVMQNGGSVASSGVVRGGWIGLNGSTSTGDRNLVSYDLLFSGMGPGTSAPLHWELGLVHIGGSANVTFAPLPETPIGFPSTQGNGLTRPLIKLWAAD